jgi:hypothetical protein
MNKIKNFFKGVSEKTMSFIVSAAKLDSIDDDFEENIATDSELKTEMNELCDLQVEFWKVMKKTLADTKECSDEELCAMWHKHFKDNIDAVKQLCKVKTIIDKTEE